jgi:NADPH:quinone reductase-like Zn-dependent oxidoreductase
MKYKAYVTEEDSKGNYSQSFKELNIDDLHCNDVLIKVKWSSLNYKDALSAKGHKGITRNYQELLRIPRIY